MQRRFAHERYGELCLHASVRGGKITKSFEELFPEYTSEEEVAVSLETAKLMEDLAKKQVERAEENARRKRTSNQDKRG